jgi:glycosyltransferase involved in cell wall biosynthesis
MKANQARMSFVPLALLTTTAPRGTIASLPYAEALERAGYQVEQRAIVESSSVRQLLSTLRIGSRIRRYGLVVANEYSTAVGLGILAVLFHAKARMVVLSLNLSRRPFKFGIAPLQRLIDRALARYDAIVVHSSPEVAGFVTLHRLDASRFHIVPWGFDLPAVDREPWPGLSPPYICVIGRNNRDFATAAAALTGTGVTGVFVGAPKSLESKDSEIRCFESLPFDDCLRIMAGALANVILVNDENRGAGHITAVAGMLLEKPHIFSAVGTLSDYLEDGRHGIAVPLHDAEAARTAVRRLASDPKLAARMGHAGRDHALRAMSHAVFMERIADVILGQDSPR